MQLRHAMALGISVAVAAITAPLLADAPPANPTVTYLGEVSSDDAYNLIVLRDAVFYVESRYEGPSDHRIGLVTDSGLDWSRYSKGLEKLIESYSGANQISLREDSSLRDLRIDVARANRTTEDLGQLRYVDRKGWRRASSHRPADDSPTQPQRARASASEVTNSKKFASGDVWTVLCIRKDASNEEDEDFSNCTFQLKRSKPHHKTIVEPLDGQASILGDAVTDAFVVTDKTLRHFDGTNWTPIDWPGAVEEGSISRAADGSLWHVEISADPPLIERRLANGTVQTIPAPSAALTSQVLGLEQGPPWFLTGGNELYVWREQLLTWQRVALPLPPHAAADGGVAPEIVSLNAKLGVANDLWAIVSYRSAKFGDDKHALLHITR